MQLEINPKSPRKLKGWIFDLYPSLPGQMCIWFITENGQRIRLVDKFNYKVYVSGKHADLDLLLSQFSSDSSLLSYRFVYKFDDPSQAKLSKVLEFTFKNYKISSFVRRVLQSGKYLRYKIHNCDLRPAQYYLYERDLFPLALVEVEIEKSNLRYNVLESVEKLDYQIPTLKVMKIDLEVDKKKRIANFYDPLKKIILSNDNKEILVDSGNEKDKLLDLVDKVRKFDPDVLLTKGGDSFIFPYLTKRATLNGIGTEFILSRDNIPLSPKHKKGRTYFSYGRTFYRAPTQRFYGRIHIDENNTFILRESGFDGLIEIARSCRVPLHRAARSSIGTSMSSLQCYQAVRDGFLISRNKTVGESFKSAVQLLVGDRGGFVYEPKMGIHENVGEVDFSSMYPSLMSNYNISSETVLCNCCPDSDLLIPQLGYHICKKRRGIVPKVLSFAVKRRLEYKRLSKETKNEQLKEIYKARSSALKWILVTCFGYLGYRNAKFGTVDGHIGVCAFGRKTFLKASHIAEKKGFNVIHGIVDSLWLKKENATSDEYIELCTKIGNEMRIPLEFEGFFKWIVFLPSKVHPNVPVLNRYYGAKRDGSIKVRGIEVRRRDTPKFIYDAQMEMINVLASADNKRAFVKKIPEALKVIKEYRKKLLDGKVTVWDLIVKKRLSKAPEKYTQKVSQLIAAEQLLKEGVEVSAGKSVKFLFTSAKNKRYNRRVRAKDLIEKGVTADVKKYLLLLYSAASNILSPFGYSEKEIYDYVRGYKKTEITKY